MRRRGRRCCHHLLNRLIQTRQRRLSNEVCAVILQDASVLVNDERLGEVENRHLARLVGLRKGNETKRKKKIGAIHN